MLRSDRAPTHQEPPDHRGQRARRAPRGCLRRQPDEPQRELVLEHRRRPWRRRLRGASLGNQPTSTTTRSRYQPHDGHTVCGVFALPQRGHRLRAGTLSRQALARRLRVFDFDVFFFGTAIVRFPRWDDWSVIDRFVGEVLPAAGLTRAARAGSRYRATGPMTHERCGRSTPTPRSDEVVARIPPRYLIAADTNHPAMR